jgi:hypothetical protein
MQDSRLNLRRIGVLLLLTAWAFLVEGYHPYAEDAEIYLPGILKHLDPQLFPFNTQFFWQHASHSFYPNVIAWSVRLLHLPLAWVALTWQLASIFLLVTAAWKLAALLFEDERACWGAAALMAVLLTLPIAGTDLYIVDQYLNPRNLAAVAAIFAVTATLRRKYVAAVLWLVFAAAVHPLMSSFPILFCALLAILDRWRPRRLGFALALPFGLTFAAPPAAYHQVAMRHPSFFLVRWEWYEWLGLVGPIALFWWFAAIARRRGMQKLELLSRAMAMFVIVAALAALVLSIPARLEALARLQPLRCLALCYMVLVIVGGGFLGRMVLAARTWRWIALFLPLSLGMFYGQRQLFPASQHIEWPFANPRNEWAQAFIWIRDNTPKNAFFGLDPRYMELPGEDENGFRARAERSRLADDVKDQGAASMFPPLSVPWLEQVEDQKNWNHFGKEDFERLRHKYGIDWVIVEKAGGGGMQCPYENAAVRACKVE